MVVVLPTAKLTPPPPPPPPHPSPPPPLITPPLPPLLLPQVCYSLLDQRAAREMASLCQEKGVVLLAYGVLAGGLLSDKTLLPPPPPPPPLSQEEEWSKMKYSQFVEQVGGWDVSGSGGGGGTAVI